MKNLKKNIRKRNDLMRKRVFVAFLCLLLLEFNERCYSGLTGSKEASSDNGYYVPPSSYRAPTRKVTPSPIPEQTPSTSRPSPLPSFVKSHEISQTISSPLSEETPTALPIPQTLTSSSIPLIDVGNPFINMQIGYMLTQPQLESTPEHSQILDSNYLYKPSIPQSQRGAQELRVEPPLPSITQSKVSTERASSPTKMTNKENVPPKDNTTPSKKMRKQKRHPEPANEASQKDVYKKSNKKPARSEDVTSSTELVKYNTVNIGGALIPYPRDVEFSADLEAGTFTARVDSLYTVLMFKKGSAEDNRDFQELKSIKPPKTSRHLTHSFGVIYQDLEKLGEVLDQERRAKDIIHTLKVTVSQLRLEDLYQSIKMERSRTTAASRVSIELPNGTVIILKVCPLPKEFDH